MNPPPPLRTGRPCVSWRNAGNNAEQHEKKALADLKKYKQQFEQGAYDDHKGRELQHLCKELRTAADVASKAHRNLITLGAATDDPIPGELKSNVDAVQKKNSLTFF